MKTSRRHELQTNELADSLARWIDRIKPYSRALTALVLAIVVAILAWGWLSAQRSSASADGWNAVFSALNSRNSSEELANVSSLYAGTPASVWSRVVLADQQLNAGTNQLFANKGGAREELRKAIEQYRAIQLDTREPILLQRATFGLARAHEALGTPNDLESARKEYRSIAEQWPDSPYAKDASQRADDLDREATKSFYDWLARYEPPAPLSNEPGIPGARPDFLTDPLGGSGLNMPSSIDDDSPLPSFGDTPSTGPLLGDEPDTKAETAGNDAPQDEHAEEPASESTGEASEKQPAEAASAEPSSDESPDQPAESPPADENP